MSERDRIYSQDDFRTGTIPKPGMVFVGDDDEYYIIIEKHPNIKLGDPALKFTDRIIDEGFEHLHTEDFWTFRPLSKEMVNRIIKG